MVVVGFLGFGVCLFLWWFMFGIVSIFVSFFEGMVKFGFLVFVVVIVIVGVSYFLFFFFFRFSI